MVKEEQIEEEDQDKEYDIEIKTQEVDTKDFTESKTYF